MKETVARGPENLNLEMAVITMARDNSAEGTVRNGTFYLDESFVPN